MRTPNEIEAVLKIQIRHIETIAQDAVCSASNLCREACADGGIAVQKRANAIMQTIRSVQRRTDFLLEMLATPTGVDASQENEHRKLLADLDEKWEEERGRQ